MSEDNMTPVDQELVERVARAICRSRWHLGTEAVRQEGVDREWPKYVPDAEAAIASIPTAQAAGMVEALKDARDAIASLPEFALGGVVLTDTHTGEATGQYGIRDELLAKIDAALPVGVDE